MFKLYTKSAKKVFCKDVIGEVNNDTGHTIKHKEKLKIDKSIIKNSGLVVSGSYKNRFNLNYKDENGNNIQFFNLRINRSQDKKVFCGKGVFAIIDLNFDAGGESNFIIREKLNFLSREKPLPEDKSFKKLSRLSSGFNEKYDFYAENGMKAMRFLSPSMAERFYNASPNRTFSEVMFGTTAFGSLVEMSLIDNKLYLFLNEDNFDIQVSGNFYKPECGTEVEDKSTNSIKEVIDKINYFFDEDRLKRINPKR